VVMTKKGMITGAEVAQIPKIEFGVKTEWAVVLHFQSPTGDSSDFLTRELPCLSEQQAQSIADHWNKIGSLVGAFEVGSSNE
jgi:hypothetical protein